jgi:hypothetical protein
MNKEKLTSIEYWRWSEFQTWILDAKHDPTRVWSWEITVKEMMPPPNPIRILAMIKITAACKKILSWILFPLNSKIAASPTNKHNIQTRNDFGFSLVTHIADCN